MKRLLLAFACVILAAAAHAQTILPDATAGAAYSFQITSNPPQPAGTTYAADGLPTGIAINASSGLISGTTAAVGTFNGNLTLTLNGAATQYPYKLTVDPAAGTPVLTSPGGAVGTVGTPFTYTLTASNGPTSFNVAQLPPGLTANGAAISGTPTTAGLYFTSVSGNNGNGQGAILVIMWTINPAGAVPAVTSALLASSPVGAAFSYAITGTNGPTSFTASNLPAGLTLNASTGVISGTPTAAGVSTVALTASNSFGASLPVNLTLTLGAFSALTSGTSLAATVGTPFNYNLTATNSPFTYTLTGLPAGLSYNNVSGLVSGTPTSAGSYTLSASATNALGAGPATALTLVVSNSATGGGGNLTSPFVLVPPAAQTTTVGSTARFTVTAVGSGTLSYQWSLNNNPISGATGPILILANVQATDAGTYTVTVANAIGSTTSSGAALTISSILVPPAITAQPDKTTSAVGTAANFTVGAAGSAPLSYQWLVNGAPIAGAIFPTLTIPSVKTGDAGNYSVTVTNSQGSITSQAASLTVSSSLIAPIFQFQPNSAVVNVGGTASFSVGVVGTAPMSYQWYKGTAAIAGAIGPGLTLNNVQAADAGAYSVVITNPGGTVTSGSAGLTVSPAGSAPVPITIALPPQSVAATIGSSATFSVAATGDPTVTYQWRKNQAAIAGATSATFTVSNVQNSDAGTYDVLVANGFSATISLPAQLTVTPVAVPSHLANVSVRAFSGSAGQALGVGFVLSGTGAKPTLIRAVGPTLTTFGVTSPLADPQLTLYGAGAAVLATNDNWGGGGTLSTTFSQVGAFALPAASLDAALFTPLQPGLYTASVQGANNGTGVVLLELYDADSASVPASRFVNLSVRGVAGSGNNVLTIGFVIGGTTGKTVLIRAVGPTLASLGVSAVLADPVLTVYDSTDTAVAANDNWGGSAALIAAFNAVHAFQLPAAAADAALVVTLGPGAYTAQVTGNGSATGVALLEIYEMP